MVILTFNILLVYLTCPCDFMLVVMIFGFITLNKCFVIAEDFITVLFCGVEQLGRRSTAGINIPGVLTSAIHNFARGIIASTSVFQASASTCAIFNTQFFSIN